MKLYHLHRCRICKTTMLSAHHLICLGCALTRDCHRYAGPARDLCRGAQR